MAFLDRSQIVGTSDRASPARGKELFAGVLLVTMIATSLAVQSVQADRITVPPGANPRG